MAIVRLCTAACLAALLLAAMGCSEWEVDTYNPYGHVVKYDVAEPYPGGQHPGRYRFSYEERSWLDWLAPGERVPAPTGFGWWVFWGGVFLVFVSAGTLTDKNREGYWKFAATAMVVGDVMVISQLGFSGLHHHVTVFATHNFWYIIPLAAGWWATKHGWLREQKWDDKAFRGLIWFVLLVACAVRGYGGTPAWAILLLTLVHFADAIWASRWGQEHKTGRTLIAAGFLAALGFLA